MALKLSIKGSLDKLGYNRQNELLVDKGTVPLAQIFPAASWNNATLVQHRTYVVKSKSHL